MSIAIQENITGATGIDEMDSKYLTFFSDSQLFGIPITDVVQIVEIQQITEVPGFPAYAKGVFNLRGLVIPLIDIRLRFNREPAEYHERTCVIIASIRDIYVGLIVDAVDEVMKIDDAFISVPPRLRADGASVRYLTGIARAGAKIVLLLDTHQILGADEAEQLSQAGNQG